MPFGWNTAIRARRIVSSSIVATRTRTVKCSSGSTQIQELKLFLLTHIDADHIAGTVPFIADARVTPERVREVWFNGRAHILDLLDVLGVEQAEFFTHDLQTRGFA